jgi:dCTP deaminase
LFINGTSLLFCNPIKDMIQTKERIHGTSYGLSEAGYDIRIKEDVWFSHLKDGRFCVQCGNDEPVSGRFTLASAIEEFQMPDNLVGNVKDKSTWARQGISVFNTVIEPGWNGFLTLEIVYHGSGDLHIPAGAGIAQVLFGALAEPRSYGEGKYQNQEAGPQKARS